MHTYEVESAERFNSRDSGLTLPNRNDKNDSIRPSNNHIKMISLLYDV